MTHLWGGFGVLAPPTMERGSSRRLASEPENPLPRMLDGKGREIDSAPA